MSKQGKSEVQKGRPGNTPGNSGLESAFNLVIFLLEFGLELSFFPVGRVFIVSAIPSEYK
jgi:hypothetical protein